MSAGELDRRITIQRYTTTTDAFNEQIEDWSDFKTLWAHRDDLSDSEKLSTDQINATRDHINHGARIGGIGHARGGGGGDKKEVDVPADCAPFRPVLAAAVDLFPHTPHVEAVVLLERD